MEKNRKTLKTIDELKKKTDPEKEEAIQKTIYTLEPPKPYRRIRPEGTKGKKILVIPDSHAKVGIPNHRYEWLGRMVVDLKPDLTCTRLTGTTSQEAGRLEGLLTGRTSRLDSMRDFGFRPNWTIIILVSEKDLDMIQSLSFALVITRTGSIVLSKKSPGLRGLFRWKT